MDTRSTRRRASSARTTGRFPHLNPPGWRSMKASNTIKLKRLRCLPVFHLVSMLAAKWWIVTAVISPLTWDAINAHLDPDNTRQRAALIRMSDTTIALRTPHGWRFEAVLLISLKITQALETTLLSAPSTTCINLNLWSQVSLSNLDLRTRWVLRSAETKTQALEPTNILAWKLIVSIRCWEVNWNLNTLMTSAHLLSITVYPDPELTMERTNYQFQTLRLVRLRLTPNSIRCGKRAHLWRILLDPKPTNQLVKLNGRRAWQLEPLWELKKKDRSNSPQLPTGTQYSVISTSRIQQTWRIPKVKYPSLLLESNHQSRPKESMFPDLAHTKWTLTPWTRRISLTGLEQMCAAIWANITPTCSPALALTNIKSSQLVLT